MTEHSYTTRAEMASGMKGGARQPSAARLMLAARLAANGHSKPFGMLTGEQILSGLTDEQRAEIATKLQPKSAKASGAAIRAAAFKEAATRQAKVMASEQYTGNEKLAANLLAHEKLSAGEIITCLSAAPKAQAINPKLAEEDAQRAAREDLRARLEANSGEQAQVEDRSLADAMRARWDGIHAEVAEERGYGAR